jgi:4-hydroxyphenylacetate 3-monooxygenase
MRTGDDYRAGLRDGRTVWVLNEGCVEDVTAHPATAPLADYYAAWYDRHFDPAWHDRLLTAPNAEGGGTPLCFVTPRGPDDLRRMGRSFMSTLMLSAGNVTHTPAYGNLIALGFLDILRNVGARADEIAKATRYLEGLRRRGSFLTLANGSAPYGFRLRETPEERAAIRLVRQTDAGIVIRGKLGMHTSPAFADEVYVANPGGVMLGERRATYVVSINAPGVTVVCRKAAARNANPFVAPLSSRFDELDGQLWLDDVLVPWERVFLTDGGASAAGHAWMSWHQLYSWAAKGEYTLGLALACIDAMGLRRHPATIEHLIDMLVGVQTVRSALAAAELDPQVAADGACAPNGLHLASGSIAMFDWRQRLTEILRILPGSSLVMAPADGDLASPSMRDGLEESFGGGGYTALQRSALLNLAWDHIASGLDGRESAFELHANGGRASWRNRLRTTFGDYNELANGVLGTLDIDMPSIDLTDLKTMAAPAGREATQAAAQR